MVQSLLVVNCRPEKSEKKQTEAHDSHAEYHPAYGIMVMTVLLGTRQKLIK